MRLFLNDYLLNDEANRTYLDEPLEGLDLTNVRTSRGSNTGQSGGWIGAQNDDVRSVSIPGHIFSNDIAEALRKRREIQAALPLHPSVIVVRIEEDGGRSYTFDAYRVDFKMPITRGREKSSFKIELEAPDPVIYDVTAGSALSATLTRSVPGGMLFSTTTPQFTVTTNFTEGQPDATVTNNSEVISYPTITIPGQITDPVLLNRTTGQSFSLTGYGVTAGSVTLIDMNAHTVTLNGGNAFGYVPLSSEWWGLVPGDNLIQLTSGSGSDVSTATITWRPGYGGI
jgi:hypothetical protein